ncbi:hypothetical protein M2459_001453 [Parabacteroides sp. PF5-5]|uniref:hypothetical protein n=1 Tax=unclassified Parabacteroides TaxID=2649774 RepID=UPI002474BCB5|nr:MULTISPECIES: hypothetical protein [unclassified Parabacteroides]MDH6304716.1 hypothetical protein [Parabacteroides sp. PH5-39]MDH6315669.1 hypothetical protein [Parabacteroides sp. PF5-13]MDH6319330.1 hypothetical protein [Parabacteroides sp. PH5-13]MDH6323061.1 hypothetical protein [Parabacteroides sp. PH5-8]MDH6326862.1 hypothetical protein [Parabacteroides sp. PH5-41]
MRCRLLKLYILLAVCLLMLVSACSNEVLPGSVPEEQERTITFTLPGRKHFVSYASLDNDDTVLELDIFMFREGTPSLLEKVFHLEGSSLGQAGTNLTATIDVTNRSGKRIFYFVANAENKASALENVSIELTTEADIQRLVSDVQSGFFKPPYLMTARQEINNIKYPTDTEIQVLLKRRVARFDIDNDSLVTNFRIDKILADNINLQCPLFDYAANTPPLATGTLPLIDFGAIEGNNGANLIENLFCFYPTEIGADKTVIWFEGELNGERRIYSLKKDLLIEANKRYILSIKKAGANFDIEIGDGEDDP